MLQSNHKDTPNTLSRHHKPKDLTIQLKNSFIFINIFKTYFLIYSVSFNTVFDESQCLMTPATIKAFVTI